MNALVLAVAALLFSRLVAPDRVEPHRKQVISAIEKTTDTLPILFVYLSLSAAPFPLVQFSPICQLSAWL